MRKDNIHRSSEPLNELEESFNNYLEILHDNDGVDSIKSRKISNTQPYTVDERIRLARMQNVNSVVRKLEPGKHFDFLQNKAMQLICIMLIVSCSLGIVLYNLEVSKSKAAIQTSSIKGEMEMSDPSSNKVFYDLFERKMAGKTIPVLLNIPGSGTQLLSSAFEKCLGLRASSDMTKVDQFETDFVLTQSFCDSRKQEMNRSPRLVVMMRNPVIRVIQQYKQVSSTKSNLSFERYLNSKFFTDNFVTRALTCKPDDATLTEEDLEAAKSILKRSVVATYDTIFSNNYIGTFTDDEDKRKTCIKEDVLGKLFLEDSVDILKNQDYIKKLRERNDVDMKLYLYSLSLVAL